MVHQHGDEHEIPQEHHVHRKGAWLPADHRVQHEWMKTQVEHVDKHPKKELIPVLKEFKDLIETNPRIYMYFTEMWDEVPLKKPYYKDPTGERKQIRDYRHMLDMLNHVFTKAPEWHDAAASVGMVGVPMVSIFDYVMATPSGHAAFLDPDVNKVLKKVLNEWGKFLQSPESAHVLEPHKQGWFSEHARKDLMQVANGPLETSHNFEDMYVCDPNAKHYGYKSWDDFFTRQLRDGVRPVASPEDDNVVANACESKPYNVARSARLRDKFWIKGQPYSVLDMLGHDPLAPQFDGATIYQAFLSALSYHRWHAPVSGRIAKAFVRDGTYFSEPLFEGLGDYNVHEIDKKGISVAQGYLTALATRAVIFIEADNPAIGLMAFIGVGMDEVSTCEITVQEGQHVKKGDQLGMFHFGGSSHCLLFRNGVKVDGFPDLNRDGNVAVRSQVCIVKMMASTTPAASADEIGKHGWTAVPVDVNAILNGKPYIHKPKPRLVRDMPFPSDDPVVAKVQDYAKAHLIPQTYHHSMRVYYWGYAILQDQFPEYADTLSLSTWALACLLHDIGTTQENLHGTLLSFEFFGGILALNLTRESGAPKAQAEAVTEAIIRHQDLGTEGNITLLGQVIQLATIYDNMGGNQELIDRATLVDVNKAWPRMGWSSCFAGTIREENGLKPWAHTTHLGEEAFPEGVENNELMKPFDN
ncbi:hypothetical protein DL770_000294 [Monosporascus sp. CRB-9-2]|nr:hypothetical protein DL770_000294 [Monosporascus sp. CRB-9-2]